jgi:molecular chaperone GrpE
MSVKDKIRKYEEAEKATAEIDSSQEKGKKEQIETLPDPAEDIQVLQEKLTTAEADSKAKYDQLLRLAAEFENYKKRTAREIEDFRKYANESLLREFLTVVDNLERAIDSANDNADSNTCVLEGVRMTLQELFKIFDKFGVKPIEALGRPFDPAFHQAILQEETMVQAENTVLKEMQRGYMIRDRLLRPAMVVVSKAAASFDGAQTDETESDTEL